MSYAKWWAPALPKSQCSSSTGTILSPASRSGMRAFPFGRCRSARMEHDLHVSLTSSFRRWPRSLLTMIVADIMLHSRMKLRSPTAPPCKYIWSLRVQGPDLATRIQSGVLWNRFQRRSIRIRCSSISSSLNMARHVHHLRPSANVAFNNATCRNEAVHHSCQFVTGSYGCSVPVI